MLIFFSMVFGGISPDHLIQSCKNPQFFRHNTQDIGATADNKETAALHMNTLKKLALDLSAQTPSPRTIKNGQNFKDYWIKNYLIENGKVLVEYYPKKQNNSFLVQAYIYGISDLGGITDEALTHFYTLAMSLKDKTSDLWQPADVQRADNPEIIDRMEKYIDAITNKQTVRDFTMQEQENLTAEILTKILKRLPGTVTELSFYSCPMNDDAMHSFATWLASSSVKELTLNLKQTSQVGLMSLIKAVRNKNYDQVWLSDHDQNFSYGCIRLLGEILRKPSNSYWPPQLEIYDIAQDESALIIEALQDNKWIRSVEFKNCTFDDQTWLKFCDVLNNIKTINIVDFHRIPMSQALIDEIKKKDPEKNGSSNYYLPYESTDVFEDKLYAKVKMMK